MAGFTIDRGNLPKLSDTPLRFVLTDGNRTIAAEITRDASLEYKEASIGPRLLAFRRREDFLQAVENAVDRNMSNAGVAAEGFIFGWADLYPG